MREGVASRTLRNCALLTAIGRRPLELIVRTVRSALRDSSVLPLVLRDLSATNVRIWLLPACQTNRLDLDLLGRLRGPTLMASVLVER